ncbi:MAG: 1-acyl-sn-glycerol-3-phosphate acyltransferase [Candidatus Thioglobus sp.]|nr:1-acyl-sn-glycerol-3-phosphate acyltransferase [Candidatus Thioglobus sp.]
MLYLRSLLFLLGSEIVLIFVVSFAILVFFLPLRFRYKVLSNWAKFNIWWLKITCKIELKVLGRENIPQQSCVIISNHQSTWETFALQKIFPHQTWVLKKELLWIPIFGWGLWLLKPIIIDRGEKLKALKKVISQGVERLKNGIFVIIFPEGTRQPYGKLGNYQKGGIAIAKKAKTPLLPVFHNSGKLWAKGSFIKFPGLITVIIGKPISAEEKSAAELVKEIRNWTKLQAKNLAD